MGQAMQKLTTRGRADLQTQKANDLKKLIEKYIDENYESAIKKRDDFYHAVYEIVEKINVQSGAMQFMLPPTDELQKNFKKIHPDESKTLTKDEFREIVKSVINVDRFHIGQGARDIFLYIFGVPVVALLAKRIIPGPTSAISDEVFIPIVTSGTVVYLAKANRL